MTREQNSTKAALTHELKMKNYWEKQAVSSDDPLRIVRTFPEDTPRFVRDVFNEFEADVARFCFEGFSGSVLDAGCGTGEILIHALRLYPESDFRYVGLDFSENILRRAFGRTELKPKASFFQGSVTNLPYRDETFDRVICSGVVTYLGSGYEIARLLSECNRVLKPGGVLIIDCFNRFAPSIMVVSLLDRSRTKPPKYVSPLWLIDETKQADFKVIAYRGFNFGLFSGYRYLLMGRWRVFDPWFVQERWSRFVEKKIVPNVDKISLFGHRVYVKCIKQGNTSRTQKCP